VRHRIRRKLQVHDVERLLRVQPAGMPRHGRAYRRAADFEHGSRVDRFTRHFEIRRRAARRDDVHEARLAAQRLRQLEHITLQSAEVVVGEAAEGEYAQHLPDAYV
jgi:hypothetical protein